MTERSLLLKQAQYDRYVILATDYPSARVLDTSKQATASNNNNNNNNNNNSMLVAVIEPTISSYLFDNQHSGSMGILLTAVTLGSSGTAARGVTNDNKNVASGGAKKGRAGQEGTATDVELKSETVLAAVGFSNGSIIVQEIADHLAGGGGGGACLTLSVSPTTSYGVKSLVIVNDVLFALIEELQKVFVVSNLTARLAEQKQPTSKSFGNASGAFEFISVPHGTTSISVVGGGDDATEAHGTATKASQKTRKSETASPGEDFYVFAGGINHTLLKARVRQHVSSSSASATSAASKVIDSVEKLVSFASQGTECDFIWLHPNTARILEACDSAAGASGTVKKPAAVRRPMLPAVTANAQEGVIRVWDLMPAPKPAATTESAAGGSTMRNLLQLAAADGGAGVGADGSGTGRLVKSLLCGQRMRNVSVAVSYNNDNTHRSRADNPVGDQLLVSTAVLTGAALLYTVTFASSGEDNNTIAEDDVTRVETRDGGRDTHISMQNNALLAPAAVVLSAPPPNLDDDSDGDDDGGVGVEGAAANAADAEAARRRKKKAKELQRAQKRLAGEKGNVGNQYGEKILYAYFTRATAAAAATDADPDNFLNTTDGQRNNVAARGAGGLATASLLLISNTFALPRFHHRQMRQLLSSNDRHDGTTAVQKDAILSYLGISGPSGGGARGAVFGSAGLAPAGATRVLFLDFETNRDVIVRAARQYRQNGKQKKASQAATTEERARLVLAAKAAQAGNSVAFPQVKVRSTQSVKDLPVKSLTLEERLRRLVNQNTGADETNEDATTGGGNNNNNSNNNQSIVGSVTIPLYQALHSGDAAATMEILSLAASGSSSAGGRDDISDGMRNTIQALHISYILQLILVISQRLGVVAGAHHQYEATTGAGAEADAAAEGAANNNNADAAGAEGGEGGGGDATADGAANSAAAGGAAGYGSNRLASGGVGNVSTRSPLLLWLDAILTLRGVELLSVQQQVNEERRRRRQHAAVPAGAEQVSSPAEFLAPLLFQYRKMTAQYDTISHVYGRLATFKSVRPSEQHIFFNASRPQHPNSNMELILANSETNAKGGRQGDRLRINRTVEEESGSINVRGGHVLYDDLVFPAMFTEVKTKRGGLRAVRVKSRVAADVKQRRSRDRSRNLLRRAKEMAVAAVSRGKGGARGAGGGGRSQVGAEAEAEGGDDDDEELAGLGIDENDDMENIMAKLFSGPGGEGEDGADLEGMRLSDEDDDYDDAEDFLGDDEEEEGAEDEDEDVDASNRRQAGRVAKRGRRSGGGDSDDEESGAEMLALDDAGRYTSKFRRRDGNNRRIRDDLDGEDDQEEDGEDEGSAHGEDFEADSDGDDAASLLSQEEQEEDDEDDEEGSDDDSDEEGEEEEDPYEQYRLMQGASSGDDGDYEEEEGEEDGDGEGRGRRNRIPGNDADDDDSEDEREARRYKRVRTD